MINKFVLGLLLGLSLPAFAGGGLDTFKRCTAAALTGYVQGYVDKSVNDFKVSHPSPTQEDMKELQEQIDSEITFSGATVRMLEAIRTISGSFKAEPLTIDEYNTVIEELNKELEKKSK